MIEQVIRRIFSQFNIDIVRESKTGELNCRCPLPDHEDRHASFSINKETGLWNCFLCGGGDINSLYALITGKTIWIAIRELREIYGLEESADLRGLKNYEQEVTQQGNLKLDIIYRSMQSSEVSQYYIDRGLTEQSWIFWEGRLWNNLIVFPVRLLNGNITALIGRNTDENVLNRYYSFEGSEYTKTLYGGFYRRYNKVIVCEGLFDCHRLHEILCNDQFKTDVVSLLTTSCSDYQRDLLGLWDEIIIWLDNDKAGKDATNKLAKKLINKGKNPTVAVYFTDAKDQSTLGVTDEVLIKGFEERRNFGLYKIGTTMLYYI
jgi:DNA primase